MGGWCSARPNLHKTLDLGSGVISCWLRGVGVMLKAPFQYFGGKSTVADLVWERFGDVQNFVEPFFGSGAVLLARPHAPQTESVNDLDGMIANFWRAVQHDPDAVARWADWPISELDLHSRHLWLLGQRADLTARLGGDPEYHDAKVAGWWLWGICSWIGSGWCSGDGPWQSVDGELTNVGADGVRRKLPHLGDAGRGVNRKRPHLSDAGQGVNRKRPHLGNAGQGACAEWSAHLRSMMQALSDRLRRVRVCNGDWSRVCGPSVTTKHGLTAVFLDPPYANAERASGLYTEDDGDVAAQVRAWAIANGDDPLLRLCLAGYDTEHGHAMPSGWEAVAWKARGGFGSQGDGLGRANAAREVLWFNKSCLQPAVRRPTLFDLDAAVAGKVVLRGRVVQRPPQPSQNA